VYQPYRDFSTSDRFKEDIVEICVRQALIDMNELETEATNLKVGALGDKSKGLIATKKFKKGELIMTPFTNIVAFAAEGSYLQKSLMRDFLKVSVPDRHGGACAFLKPLKLTYGLVDDASTFIVPFSATYANPTSDTKTANMVEFSYKAKGGITIPCIKNNVPIDEGDVIVMFRGKKRQMVDVITDAAAVESDEKPEAKAGRIEGKGKSNKGRGKGLAKGK
jgi:hypothetical protein